MKKESVKKHLNPYSILQKRKTTINHAFASAIAPYDSYDPKKVEKALHFLGNDPDGELICIYCGGKAETWDHLVGLVKDSQLRGSGHQLGNLVPCCKVCNSKKGGKDWKRFIDELYPSSVQASTLKKKLSNYLKRYAKPIRLKLLEKKCSKEWERYSNLRKHIFKLMKKADKLAELLRKHVVE